jgi:hypothetical protein
MYHTERLSRTEEILELSVSEGLTDMTHASRILCKLYLNSMFIDNTRKIIRPVLFLTKGTHQHSSLGYYATSRKVAGSIPNNAIGMFNLPNISSRTMDLGWTQPLTENSTRKLLWGKWRPARKTDNLTAIWSRLSGKCWSIDVSQPNGTPRPLTFYFIPYNMKYERPRTLLSG